MDTQSQIMSFLKDAKKNIDAAYNGDCGHVSIEFNTRKHTKIWMFAHPIEGPEKCIGGSGNTMDDALNQLARKASENPCVSKSDIEIILGLKVA